MENWQFIPAQDFGQPLKQQLKSARREGGLFAALTHLAWYCLVKIYLSLFHRLTIAGKQHLPRDGSFIIVSNHASHLDSLVLASAISWRLQGRVFPVAAGDTFFASRLKGTLSMLLINALPMWRKRSCSHGLTDLRNRLLREPCIYIVFPEGTRTRTGRVGAFRAGIGMLVAGSSVPVVPCHVSGTFLAMPYHRRFPRPTKLRLTIGEPITFCESPDDRQGWEHVARTIETAVLEMCVD